MKIFILNPLLFTEKLHNISRKRQPLSLAYIASLLRKDNEIKLLDANAENISLEKVLEIIKEFDPEILVMTSTPVDRWEVPSHSHIKLLIDNIIKTVNTLNITNTILIGSHGTIIPEEILRKTKANFVVRSEPEMIVFNLVNAIKNKTSLDQVAGISYLKDDKFINNPDAERNNALDDMPWPAYDLLPMDKYAYTFSDIPRPFSLMITSRGCPFNCIYCLKAMLPHKYIVRSPQNVIDEIKYLIDNFGIKGIYFQDWEFCIHKKRVEEICDLILKNNLEFTWGCNARAPDLTDELMAKMKSAGCKRINMGFETASQKILDISQKRTTVEQFKEAIRICRKHDINIGAYAILNLPGETRKTIAETEKFLAEHDVKTLSTPNLPIPYIGTGLYDKLVEQEGRDIAWEDLEKYAGKVGVKQSPWLAKIYRWHYKYKYIFGNFYFFKPVFIKKVIKRFFKK